MISLGNRMCHQNPSAIKKPPAPSNELSPIVVANGVQRMRRAIGVSHSFDAGVGLEIVTKEFDFGTQSSIDIVLVISVMC